MSAVSAEPPNGPQIHLHAPGARAAPSARRHPRRRLQFDAVPLAVVERERVALVALPARIGQAGGGIEPATQQADGFERVGSFGQLQRQQESDHREDDQARQNARAARKGREA